MTAVLALEGHWHELRQNPLLAELDAETLALARLVFFAAASATLAEVILSAEHPDLRSRLDVQRISVLSDELVAFVMDEQGWLT